MDANAIAIWQAIVATTALLLGFIAGILGVLGYMRIIRTTDENAKERQEAIDNVYLTSSKAIQDQSEKITTRIKKDSWMVKAFVILGAIVVFTNIYNMSQLRQELKEHIHANRRTRI